MAGDPALLDRVRRRLAADGVDPTAARLTGAVVEAGVHGDQAVREATRALAHELVGAGPLTPLLADPTVTDVLVNGPDEVWVDRGAGAVRADVRFRDADAVRALAVRLTARAGRRLDDAEPFADVVLPGGARLHAVLAPVAAGGPVLSLRVPRRVGFSFDELVAAGTIPEPLAEPLAAAVRARLSGLVTGGTGSGKTTVLSALLGLVEPAERVVLVEDVPELRPALPHVVRLATRPANAEGVGEIGLAALVRQTLRMRPDRVVLGEARGRELVDLLTALNTGHEGGWATLHANAPQDVPARVQALCWLAGLPGPAALALLVAAVDVVVHVTRGRDGRRVVSGLHVLERDWDGALRVVPVGGRR